MASHNSYPGYIKLPGKDVYDSEVRLDFNVQINSEPDDTRVDSYTLRLFTIPNTENAGKGTEPEMSVSLTTQQWLDLIESMKEEVDISDKVRKSLDEK